ncbi:VOC family protein [Alkalihalobacillus deserti]|uniref:VOC family protein n=1 Tax=Alkalihalobacillus deserti TaxID=2879466 RepID=UPI001D139F54|nr:VOC family protein [Alkalihalobacillus deserti]
MQLFHVRLIARPEQCVECFVNIRSDYWKQFANECVLTIPVPKCLLTHLPSVKKLLEVELQVSNLDNSLTFYQELIGYQVLERDEKTAKLTTDGGVPQLLLKEEKSFVVRPSRTTGLFHFAIVVPTRQDLAISLIHLLETGYPIQGASDHQYSEAVYLSDPDNNGIEIYVERSKSLVKRRKWRLCRKDRSIRC